MLKWAIYRRHFFDVQFFFCQSENQCLGSEVKLSESFRMDVGFMGTALITTAYDQNF